jgi:hypothetical protein
MGAIPESERKPTARLLANPQMPDSMPAGFPSTTKGCIDVGVAVLVGAGWMTGANRRIRSCVDLGGTEIEVLATYRAGRALARRRVATPRHGYEGSIRLVAEQVALVEQEAERTTSARLRGREVLARAETGDTAAENALRRRQSPAFRARQEARAGTAPQLQRHSRSHPAVTGIIEPGSSGQT